MIRSSLPDFRRSASTLGVLAVSLMLVACGGDEADGQSATDGGQKAGASSSSPSSPAATTAPAGKTTAAAKPGKLEGPDITGIFLGMTQDQVQAVFTADKPPVVSQVMQKTITYNVLGKRMKTDPFPSNLIAQYKEPNATIVLEAGIAPPPSAPVVISARRHHRQDLQRLPRADYRAALIKKYGEPSYEQNADMGSESITEMTWLLTDGVQCVRNPLSTQIGESVADRIMNPQGVMNNPEAKSEADCANFLIYQLREDPVRVAQGVLWNVKADLASQKALNQWIADKQAEASKPGSETPNL